MLLTQYVHPHILPEAYGWLFSHFPLMPLDIPVFWYPPSHGLPIAEKVVSPAASCNTGVAGCSFTFPLWLLPLIVQPCSILPLVWVGAGEVLTISALFKLFLFVCASVTYWKFPSGNLNFCNFSLIPEYLHKSVFSRFLSK